MTRLLHIDASPRERSRTRPVAHAFLEEYRKLHPDHTLQTLNIWDEALPPFDGAASPAAADARRARRESSAMHAFYRRAKPVLCRSGR